VTRRGVTAALLALDLVAGCGGPQGPARDAEGEGVPGADFRPSEPAAPPETGRAAMQGQSGDEPSLELVLSTDDPTYGFTRENPVRLGSPGGASPLLVRRFLSALWGPAGQPLRYERAGACSTDPDRATGEAYSVTYEGLDAPLILYFELRSSGDLRVPVGLSARPATEPDPDGS
jgi:hypothetical protein